MPDIPMRILYLKHRGLFDHAKLVKGIQQWFVDNEYKFHAPKYKLKASEAEYEIEGERQITEYVKFKLALHIWIREMSDVDVIEDGEKKKRQEGMINMELGGSMELDPAKRFSGNKFFQWLQDFYHEYVIKVTIDQVWWDDLYFKLIQLQNTIKGILGTEVG